MFDETNSNYNKYIPISKPFNNYRTYMTRINNWQFLITRHFKLIYVVKGGLRLKLGERTVKLRKGDVFYLGPNIPYKLESYDGENTILNLDIKPNYMKRILGKDGDHMILEDLNMDKDIIIKPMIKLYLALLYDQWNHSSVLDMLNQLILDLDKSKSSKYIPPSDASIEYIIHDIAKWIINNMEFINHNDIRLKDIADESNINYYYLSRKFKEVIGLSYTELLSYIRLEKAVEKLINTEDPINIIAYEANFKNVRAFNLNFKEIFNTTPMEFRKKHMDFHKALVNDKLHQEKETRDLFKRVNSSNNKYFMALPQISYDIDLSQEDRIPMDTLSDLIDLNNIIDVSHDIYYISQIAEDFKSSNIVINITCHKTGLYLIDKMKNKVPINLYMLKHIIDEFRNNDSNIFLTFNYDLHTCDPISRTNVSKLLRLLKKNELDFKNYIFGLRLWGMKSHIEEGEIPKIMEYIDEFLDISRDIFSHEDYKWMLYLDDEIRLEDKDYLESLSSFLTQKPDKYLITYELNRSFIGENISLDNYMELTQIIKEILDVQPRDLIIKIRHRVSNTLRASRLEKEFLTLLSINFFFKLKSQSFSFAYFDYYFEDDQGKSLVRGTTHDKLGLAGPQYLIYDLLSSLEGDLMIVSDELVLIESNKSIYVLLCSNYLKYLEYLLNTKFIDRNKILEYKLNFKDLQGSYKVLSYSFNLYNKERNFNEDELISISNEDRQILALSRGVDSNIEFKKAEDSLKLNLSKDILDLSFFKIEGLNSI